MSITLLYVMLLINPLPIYRIASLNLPRMVLIDSDPLICTPPFT
jgi:hypothetical protein